MLKASAVSKALHDVLQRQSIPPTEVLCHQLHSARRHQRQFGHELIAGIELRPGYGWTSPDTSPRPEPAELVGWITWGAP